MPKKKNRVGRKYRRLFFFKEIVLSILAVISVIIVFVDFVYPPTPAQHDMIIQIDFTIACMFLLDFTLELIFAKNRKKYFRQNWYLLFASIPLTDTVTEALRGLRVLRLVRIVRAGEHLKYGLNQK